MHVERENPEVVGRHDRDGDTKKQLSSIVKVGRELDHAVASLSAAGQTI